MAKRLRSILWGLASLFALLAFAAWWLVRGSLPTLDGRLDLAGLSAAVEVERDRDGVVTIDASNQSDAARALGYVHAQERYFEMDLMRRTAAGELAELLGPSMLKADRKHRIHRFRHRARLHSEAFAGGHAETLRAYTEGVNAGLAHLKVRPWPYLLLGQAPQPWQAEDSALAGYAMYVNLQDASNGREAALRSMRPHLPAAVFDLLLRDGTRWDAPMQGQARGDAVLPDADAVDLRKLPGPVRPRPAPIDSSGTPGSNNFAVAGALTSDGRAILADDMHSRLSVPNVWFRARLRYGHETGRVDVSGFTLPGLPVVIAGSNGKVAWGFTNGYADTLDWDPHCGGKEASSCAALLQRKPAVEIIRVKGRDPVVLRVLDDERGPLIVDAVGQPPMQLHWTAYRPEGLNLDLATLHHARDVREALSQARTVGLPTANLMLADRRGRIAWTLIGPTIPAHDSSDCRWPGTERASSERAATKAGPDSSMQRNCPDASAESAEPPSIPPFIPPFIIDPPDHRLWTANNRTLDAASLNRIGDGGYSHGARAGQIRDALQQRRTFAEPDLLAVQLDDRALMLTPWWELMQAQARRGRSDSALAAMAQAAARWEGRASADSVSYRLVRAWRLAVHARILDGLTAPAQARMKHRFVMPQLPQFEGVAWPLATAQPKHLLSRRYPSWEALFEDAAQEVRQELSGQGALAQRTWGERNTAAICHPLASAVPLLGKRLLCMPRDPLPGDSGMPRVQGPAFGATERMVVSPGHEDSGIAHMPGGQSGHVFSPFWGRGHDDWVQGRRSPFLPGPAVYSLALTPERKL